MSKELSVLDILDEIKIPLPAQLEHLIKQKDVMERMRKENIENIKKVKEKIKNEQT